MSSRSRDIQAIFALFLATMAGALAGPAWANASTTRGSHSTARQIEWSKTVYVGSLRLAQSPAMSPNLAGYPVACYKDAAHPVSYGGVDRWYDNSLASRGIYAYVEYLWCPLSQSDTVGVNFSLGSVQITSGNWVVTFGSEGSSPQSYTWDGASIHHNGCVGCNQPPDYYGDGLVHQSYDDESVIFDYSLAGRGDWQWSAQFWAAATIPGNPTSMTLAAISPTF